MDEPDIDGLAKIIDPEAFGLPDNADPTSLTDRDIARDRARLIVQSFRRATPRSSPPYPQ